MSGESPSLNVSDIVDTHAHIIAPDTDKYPLAPIGGKVSEWAIARPVDAEGMIERMDATGIATSILVQASTAHGYDCSYVADSMDSYPDRFMVVCCVDPFADNALEMVEHWIGKRNMNGIRLFTVGSTMTEQSTWIDDPAVNPVWDGAAEHNVTVCLQMKLEAHEALRTVLERYPNVRIFLDHMAYPEVNDGPPFEKAAPLFDLAGYPNLYLKLTHRTLELLEADPDVCDPFLEKLIGSFGANRIAWGSNCPASEIPLDKLVALAAKTLANVNPTDKALIMGGTARTLYPVH